MANWLKNILDDVEQKRSMRPDWMRSEEARTELARLDDKTLSIIKPFDQSSSVEPVQRQDRLIYPLRCGKLVIVERRKPIVV